MPYGIQFKSESDLLSYLLSLLTESDVFVLAQDQVKEELSALDLAELMVDLEDSLSVAMPESINLEMKWSEVAKEIWRNCYE